MPVAGERGPSEESTGILTQDARDDGTVEITVTDGVGDDGA